MKTYKDFMSSVWVKGNNNEIKEYSEHILGMEFKKVLMK